MLTQLAQQLTNDQLERLAAIACGDESQVCCCITLIPQHLSCSRGMTLCQPVPPELSISKDVLNAYATLFKFLNLQTVLSKLSDMQIMKLYEVIPSEYSEVSSLSMCVCLCTFSLSLISIYSTVFRFL
jgi:hypothetical protein